MAIPNFRKLFGESEKEKPGIPLPSSPKPAEKQEEEKKDPSVFGGRPFLRGNELRQWLKRPDLYQETKIPREKRLKLGQELFRRDYIKPRGVIKKERELKRAVSSAKTSREREQRLRELRLIRSFLGKDK